MTTMNHAGTTGSSRVSPERDSPAPFFSLSGGAVAYPYYRFFPGDYLRDTRRLTLLQHGAYHLLIHEYMATAKPLRGDLDAMCRVCGALSGEERKAVEFVLAEFFTMDGPLWRHKRCDAELAKLDDRSQAARESAERRWVNSDANAMRTHSGRNANQNQNQNQIPKPEPRTKPSASATPPQGWACTTELWQQFVETRKALRSPLTQHGAALLVARLNRLCNEGQNPTAVVEQSIERGWKGFFPVDKGVRGKAHTLAEKRASNWADICGVKNDSGIVDGKTVLTDDGDVREQDGVDVGRLPQG